MTVTLKRRSMDGVTNLGFSQTSSLAAEDAEGGADDASAKKADAIPEKYKEKKKKVLKKKGKKKKVAAAAAAALAVGAGEATPDGEEPKIVELPDGQDDAEAGAGAGAAAAAAAAAAAVAAKGASGAGSDSDSDSDSASDSASDSDNDNNGKDDDAYDADYIPPEFEDDGRDKAKLKEFKARESFPVHCPLFPELKDEWWWVFVAHSEADMALSMPICVKTLKDEESMDLTPLPMPSEPGSYKIRLFVCSDSYQGIDQEIVIPFTCVKGEVVEEKHDPLVEEEDSDAFTESDSSDEDSDF